MTVEAVFTAFEYVQAASGGSDPVFEDWAYAAAPNGYTARDWMSSSFTTEGMIASFDGKCRREAQIAAGEITLDEWGRVVSPPLSEREITGDDWLADALRKKQAEGPKPDDWLSLRSS